MLPLSEKIKQAVCISGYSIKGNKPEPHVICSFTYTEISLEGSECRACTEGAIAMWAGWKKQMVRWTG